MSGIEAGPGGLIHFRRTIEITADSPPFTPAFIQNQSIVGRKCRVLGLGQGWLKRGKPSAKPRMLFNSRGANAERRIPRKRPDVSGGAVTKVS